ncbi:disintegrin and metalloproteinase domain-containing protein 18-like [Ictidomys tridecemlineatus]|nr:disintegrin and metalloproteinase domain-containing protein 18-like [Ictidomys tridecemlineatus]
MRIGTSGAVEGWVLPSTGLAQDWTNQPRPPIFTTVWLPGNSFDPALQDPSSWWPRDPGVALQPPSLWPGSKSSLLQITVPEKFDKNTNRKDVTETHGDCFYQGNVEDIPQSAVTLNVCSGLRGFLLLENVSYGIEPLESSAVFEHMIYQINNDQVEYPPLIEGYSRSHYIGQPYRILVKTDKISEITLKTTLKIQIIIDKAMDHPNFVGATYHGMACDPKFSAGILLHPKTISLEAFSVVLAQLIGINLGLAYDDVYNCYCPESTCIMNPGAIQSQGVKVFSRCSTDVFKQIISQPQFGCLRKKKLLSQLTAKQSPPACGNGVVEIGEDCDCGKPEVCKYTKCCNAESCTFTKPNLECGSGPCCNPSSCTLYERGHLCRRSRDDCDFAEFCNGTSEFCMPDVKAANLEPCHNYTAYCLYGLCRDPSRQCKEIFGRYALNAPYICIEEVNFQNDKFGNCGKSCNFGFILCGKVVCSYGHTEIADMKDYDFQYTYLAGHVCVSAHLRNTSRRDDTYAHTANPCDEDRSCNGRSCVLVHEHPFKAPCNSHEQCRGHGICNSKLHCHCDAGYAPPDCEELLSSPGGSFDDGFWVSSDQAKLMLLNQKPVPKKNGLLISFYIFLPFLIITSMVVLKWDKMKEFLHREETLSGGCLVKEEISCADIMDS